MTVRIRIAYNNCTATLAQLLLPYQFTSVLNVFLSFQKFSNVAQTCLCHSGVKFVPSLLGLKNCIYCWRILIVKSKTDCCSEATGRFGTTVPTARFWGSWFFIHIVASYVSCHSHCASIMFWPAACDKCNRCSVCGTNKTVKSNAVWKIRICFHVKRLCGWEAYASSYEIPVIKQWNNLKNQL